MLYKKIVVVSSHELDKRISILFRTEEIVKKGIDIEYWNVSNITYDEHVVGIDSAINTITIKNKKDFEQIVLEYADEKVLYIVYLNYSYKTFYCYWIFSRYNADILYCINGVLPNALSNNTRKTTFKVVINGIKNRIIFQLLRTSLIKPAKYELRTCAKAGHAYKIDDNTYTILYNSTDYEDSLILTSGIYEKPYIVFIDQYLPLHPDNKIVGESGANVELYYNQMNRFFELLESNYQCEVIIAAHPASISYSRCNPFGNRKLIAGKTKELVRNCKFVVAHFSTAIYFAVIYKKPLILISSNDISKNLSRAHASSYAFARELDCDFIMLDNLSRVIEIKEINNEVYNNFKYDYITNSHTENISNEEILMSIIKGDYE